MSVDGQGTKGRNSVAKKPICFKKCVAAIYTIQMIMLGLYSRNQKDDNFAV